MKKRKILIVEDAIDLANAVSKALSKEYSVMLLHRGDGVLSEISGFKPDLILLDINLPGISGFELAEGVRDSEIGCKIIALTARDGIKDKLEGFELGFDDYITKPFDMRELMARVKVVINRDNPTPTSEKLKFSGMVLDSSTRTLKRGSAGIELTKLEFDLLHMLLLNSPAVVEQAKLIDELWGEDTDLLDPPIRSHIKNLRKKIGDTNYDIIITVPGVGYKIEHMKEC